jgi:hypothetical protein
VVPNVAHRFFTHIMGACGSCYLERREGQFIIGEPGNQFFNIYVRECTAFLIDNLSSEVPQGYALHGMVRA